MLESMAITFAALAVGTNMSLGIVMDLWDRWQRYQDELRWKKQMEESKYVLTTETAAPIMVVEEAKTNG